MAGRSRPKGRILKLTPDLQEKYCRLVEDGAPYMQAAKACGVHYDSIRRWMSEGEQEAQRLDESGGDVLDEKVVYYEFFIAVSHAQAKALELATAAVRVALIGKAKTIERTTEEFIQKRMNAYGKEYDYKEVRTTTKEIIQAPDAHLAIKVLERRDPDNWGRKTSDTVINIDIHAQHATAADEFDTIIASIASRKGTERVSSETKQNAEGGA
jgi:transposase